MKAIALAVLLGLVPGAVLAQESKQPWDEYGDRIKASESFGTSGPGLFGDSINLANGSLSFSATDVSLPGNGSLPVALTRRLSVSNRKGYQVNDALMGDWDLDLPHISGVFVAGGSSFGTACTATTPVQARPPYVTVSGGTFPSSEYWSGNTANMPGGGEMLLVNPGTPKPASGGPYYWMTSGFTYFSCLATLKNGGTGEGFLAVASDGTKYWFDVLAQYDEPPIDQVVATASERSVTGPWSASATLLRRRKVLYASRVEDRFGNWVAYQFTNSPTVPAVLSEISASDGRRITLSYNAQGKVATVVSNGRTWSYAYAYPTPQKATLTSVTLPDGSAWSMDLAAISSAAIRYIKGAPGDPNRDCYHPGDVATAGATGSITHPSGATAEFTVDPTRHGRSNVPMVCSGYSQPYNNPNDDVAYYPVAYDLLSLTRKRISGPGLATAEWNYAYTSNASFAPGTGPVCYSGNCMAPICTADACAGTSKTYVWGPENEYTLYTYGNSYRYNEGKLLQVQTGTGTPMSLTATPVIARTEAMTYELGQSGLSFQTPIGTSPQMKGEGFASEYIRPQTSRLVEQENETYATTLGDFDAFARSRRSSKVSSLGYERTDATVFHDDLSLWVLGQVHKITCTAAAPASPACDGGADSVVSQTDYGYKALPGNTYRFGQLQHSLGYYTYTTPGSDGLLKQVTDGRGYRTTLSNWYRGVPRTITHPDGFAESAVVNADGTIASVTDEGGSTTSYEYDAMGRLALTEFPAGDSVSWAPVTQDFRQIFKSEYGIPSGHWRQSIAQGDYRKYRYFDALWRPILEQEFDNADVVDTRRVTARHFDHEGRETFVSYPGAVPANPSTFNAGTYSTYDTLGRKRSVRQTSEHGTLTTTLNYASNGGYLIATNPRGYVTRTFYQAFDQPAYDAPVKITRDGDIQTYINRDVFGKPITMTQRNAAASDIVTRRYYYDPQQRLCRQHDPEAKSTAIGYDAAGNVAWTAPGLNYSTATACYATQAYSSGRRIDRTYDKRNRLLTVRHPDGRGDLDHTYTPDGLVESVVADNGTGNLVTTSYSYNRRRLLEGERMQWGSIDWPTTYSYNVTGHLLSSTGVGGLKIDYVPNALGQPTRAGTYATGASYFPSGALRQFTYGNGIVHTLTQNARGLPERSRDAYGSAAVEDDSYDYDFNGNVAAISDGLPGAPGNRTMTYDSVDRLTGVTAPMFGGDGKAVFTYDAVDNLLSARVGNKSNVSYTFDDNNRLTNVLNSAGATITGLGYDEQGNVTNKNGQVLDFDYGNRLRSLTDGSQVSSYVYDGLGRRTRDFMGGSKYSLYSQAGQLIFDNDLRKKTQHWYVYLGGSLVATRERDTTTGTASITYLHTDALGSPVAVTDSARNVVERNQYAPYGALLGKPNPDAPGYTGHVMDAATKLTYMQQRYYDPGLGRFLSVDPVTALDNGDMRHFNRYAYAYNNPYKFTDPDGRCPSCVGAAVGAGADILMQGIMIAAGAQDEFSVGSVVTSAGTGALGVGLAGKLGRLGSMGVDAVTSVVSSGLKGEDVTVEGVVADVIAGQVGGKAAARAEAKLKAGAEYRRDSRAAGRQERIGSRIGARRAQVQRAQTARATVERGVAQRGAQAGVAASGVASTAVRPLLEEKDRKGGK